MNPEHVLLGFGMLVVLSAMFLLIINAASESSRCVDALDRCPFCGCTAHLKSEWFFYWRYTAMCANKECLADIVQANGKKTEAEAIAAWNTRHVESQ